MNTTDTIISRVEKLLALSTSPNEHEARAALAKAQELIEKYRLEGKFAKAGQAPRAQASPSASPAQAPKGVIFPDLDTIVGVASKLFSDEYITYETVLVFKNNSRAWLVDLTSAICEANDCLLWRYGSDLQAAGRQTNLKLVKVLLKWTAFAIEGLWKAEAARKGGLDAKEWAKKCRKLENSFKLGVVHRFAESLFESKDKTAQEAMKALKGDATTTAVSFVKGAMLGAMMGDWKLAVQGGIENAKADLAQTAGKGYSFYRDTKELERVKAWVDENVKLDGEAKKTKRKVDKAAFDKGWQAGEGLKREW